MVSLFRTLFVRTVPPPSGVRRERRRRWSPAVVVNFAHVVERGLPYRPKTRNRYRSRILVSPPTPRFGPVSRRWSADVSVNEYVRSRGVLTAIFVDNNNKKIHPHIVSRDHRQSCSSRLINRLSTPPPRSTIPVSQRTSHRHTHRRRRGRSRSPGTGHKLITLGHNTQIRSGMIFIIIFVFCTRTSCSLPTPLASYGYYSYSRVYTWGEKSACEHFGNGDLKSH